MPQPPKRGLEYEAVLERDQTFERGDVASLRETHEVCDRASVSLARRDRRTGRFSGTVRYVHETQTMRENPNATYRQVNAAIKSLISSRGHFGAKDFSLPNVLQAKEPWSVRMHIILKPLMAAATLLAIACPAFAADGPAQEGSLWSIGTTGIMCYVAPCPWRGIAPISLDGKRGFPINREDRPEPQFTTDNAEIGSAVETAYADNRCLIVAAKRDGEWLDITRIVGDC